MFGWILFKIASTKLHLSPPISTAPAHVEKPIKREAYTDVVNKVPTGNMEFNPSLWADTNPSGMESPDLPQPRCEAKTLQDLCKKTIIQTITLSRISKVDTLPVPAQIKEYLKTFRIPEDFDTSGNHWSYNYHFPYHPHHRTHRVHPAVCRLDNTHVLIKAQNEDAKDCALCTMLGAPLLHTQESDHWARVKHRYLQTCYMKLVDPYLGVICYVLEYPKISLKDLIGHFSVLKTFIPERLIWDTIRKLVSVIIFLRSKGVFVEMYEPQHFVLTESGEVKVENLLLYLPKAGVSTYRSGSFMQQNVIYAAPEQLHGRTDGRKSVAWSLGCLLYEMSTLTPAFMPESDYNYTHLYCPQQRPHVFGVYHTSGSDLTYCSNALQLPEQYSEDLHTLITWCLKKDPEDRPDLEDMELFADNTWIESFGERTLEQGDTLLDLVPSLPVFDDDDEDFI